MTLIWILMKIWRINQEPDLGELPLTIRYLIQVPNCKPCLALHGEYLNFLMATQ